MSFTVNERTTRKYLAQFQDENGAPIPAASLTTVKLTLIDAATGQTINGRLKQNVLNANGVVIDGSGNLAWTMTPADNAIITPSVGLETHTALFEWTWAAGSKANNKEVTFFVVNLNQVP